MREGGREGEIEGGWADNKGHWKCVLHPFIPFLQEANMHSVLDRIIERQGGQQRTRCHKKHFSV